jgi:hypothetical protein
MSTELKEENKIKEVLEMLGIKTGPVVIGGTLEDQTQEFIYFQDDGKHSFSKQFDLLFDLLLSNRDYKSDGSMMAGGSIIITPDNMIFHCISLFGDKENWRKGFIRAANILGIIVGDVVGPKYKTLGPNPEDYVNLESYKETGKAFDFVLSDGRAYKLSDCEIHMPSDWLIPGIKRGGYEAKLKEFRKLVKERIKAAKQVTKHS